MNGKKTLPLLVIASLMLSMLPSVLFANAAITTVTFNTVNTTTHAYTALVAPHAVTMGVTVSAAGTGAIAGTTVGAYWDNPNIAWNGVAGLVNSTTVGSGGAFDVWVKIPEATNGAHYLWLKDSSNNIYGPFPATGLTVGAKISVSPSRALPGDVVTITMNGYSSEATINWRYNTTIVTGTATSNTLGTATATFTVSDRTPFGGVNFGTWAVDTTAPFVATTNLVVGPVITTSVTSGAVGIVITVNGRGLTPGAAIAQGNLALGAFAAYITTPVPFNVDATGRIRISAVIPQQAATGTYTLALTSAAGNAQADFEVTALASISVSPSFGPVASAIVITGTNFPRISGISVPITMTGGLAVGTATTAADGTFSGTFTVPATTEGAKTITAATVAGTYNIADDVGFKVGTMNIILSKTSAAAGRSVTISGNGFTALSTWNATFGDKTVISAGTTDGSGILVTAGGAATFQVPQLPAGTYTIIIWDETAEISLTAPFTITQTTSVTLSSANVPNNFNVTLRGRGFSDVALAPVEFIIYNTTSAGATDFWWTMTVTNRPWNLGAVSTSNSTGEFYGWWLVDPFLSNGNYKINATDLDGYTVTVPFTVSDEHIVAVTRKSSFGPGETITFNLEHSFGGSNAMLPFTYVKIWNPSGTLVFTSDQWGSAGWVRTGDWYTLPYSVQNVAGNPITLLDDAPAGTWTWTWYDNGDDAIQSGSFTVTSTPVGTVDEQIAALAAQITAVSTTVASVATTATAASNAATAASTAASAAASAAQAATDAANAAGVKADAAKTAAESAAAAANGLTTLVYAAIGASLVAALAAIVALMQISRKIA